MKNKFQRTLSSAMRMDGVFYLNDGVVFARFYKWMKR